jgi:hypothetical protein
MSRLPVFEDTHWRPSRHHHRLQWFTDITWGGNDYRIVLVLGTKKVYVDLISGYAHRMTLTVDMFHTRLIDLQRFAFDSVVYYLSQATPLVGAVQDPLPYWQH